MDMTILVLLASTLAFTVSDHPKATHDAKTPSSPVEVGRYQLVVSPVEGRIYVLDTATAQCWSRAPGGVWRDEGNPTKSKGRRSERQGSGAIATLNLPEKTVEMVVVQREERALPGSDGSVRVRLGDITEGQTLLSVITIDDEPLVERTSVRQGDKVEFSLGKKRYTVQIKELRNILIGDDFAKITISETADEKPPRQRRDPSGDR